MQGHGSAQGWSPSASSLRIVFACECCEVSARLAYTKMLVSSAIITDRPSDRTARPDRQAELQAKYGLARCSSETRSFSASSAFLDKLAGRSRPPGATACRHPQLCA